MNNETTESTRRESYEAIKPETSKRGTLILEVLGDKEMTVDEIVYALMNRGKIHALGKYRKVNAEELDEILKKYGDRVLSICSSRSRGAMTMWACFKSRINSGCYSDMINAYTLLSDDPKSLHEREHELRHAWDEYEELWAIRYHGTLEQYYLDEAKKAREHAERYQQTETTNKGDKKQ